MKKTVTEIMGLDYQALLCLEYNGSLVPLAIITGKRSKAGVYTMTAQPILDAAAKYLPEIDLFVNAGLEPLKQFGGKSTRILGGGFNKQSEALAVLLANCANRYSLGGDIGVIRLGSTGLQAVKNYILHYRLHLLD